MRIEQGTPLLARANLACNTAAKVFDEVVDIRLLLSLF